MEIMITYENQKDFIDALRELEIATKYRQNSCIFKERLISEVNGIFTYILMDYGGVYNLSTEEYSWIDQFKFINKSP